MSDFNSKDFGERLNNYRIRKELTHETLASVISKSQSTIRWYESREIIPDVRDVSLMCKISFIFIFDYITKKFAPDKYILEINIGNGMDRLMLWGYF